MISRHRIVLAAQASGVINRLIIELLLAKDKQITRLQDIIEDYQKREAKVRDENIHIKQSIHITVGRKESSLSPNLLRDKRKAKEEIMILNLRIEKLTRDNQKLRNSNIN
jgi:hypothetical protein